MLSVFDLRHCSLQSGQEHALPACVLGECAVQPLATGMSNIVQGVCAILKFVRRLTRHYR